MQTVLYCTCPYRGVDDLQEQLAGARVEDEDCAVDGLRREIALL